MLVCGYMGGVSLRLPINKFTIVDKLSRGWPQWKLLHSDYRETVESIKDIRTISDDFEGLCQRNLAANSGSILDVEQSCLNLISTEFPLIDTCSKF